MILSIWTILLILTGAFIWYGRNHQAPPLEVSGYTFLFLLGLVLLLGSVTYPSGEITYITNVNVYNETVAGVDTQTNTTFTNYSGEIVQGIQLHHFFGLFISIVAAFGFINFFLNFKGADF